MNIVICDDEPVYREEIKPLAEHFFGERIEQDQINCITCASAKEVMELEAAIDLLLLDVELKNENGIEFRRQIFESGWEVPIVFISAYENYIGEAFGKNVYGFIRKPIRVEEFEHALQRVYEECLLVKNYEINDGIYVREKDILFIKAFSDYSHLSVAAGEYISDMTLSEWKETLPETLFVQVHRACIVNMQHIHSMEKDILLKNGVHIAVSRRRLKEVKMKYQEYLRRRANALFR
ncbi:MAG: LytTR family DNA-binding domain-containing protein [Clostridium sp.]|nr:LytTR family DNA-binding domain-containing protein [Clostridium sp.]